MPLKKLKEEEKATTEALLAAIEKKDRRFRLFQTLFMVGTFVGLMFIIGSQRQTLVQVENQQKQAEDVALETAKRSQDQQDKIIRRLNCMVVFFSETNRSGLSIEDIDRCTLNRDSSVQQFFQQPEPIPAEQPPSVSSRQSAVTPPAEAPVPREAPAPPAKSQPDVVEPRPPAALDLPILNAKPLCVPLVRLCVQ